MKAQLHIPATPPCAQKNEAADLDAAASGIAVLQLHPDERLRVNDRSDNVVCVIDGTMYVAFEDDDVILTPGDQLTIRAGEDYRAWNAGDEAASVVVGEVKSMAGARERLRAA
jgi:mannose-6-phosphate isomerase-like protein (cupin superfamily)